MFPRFVELERRTILVQFINIKPLAFYATADGTDLVQDILRTELSRSESNILGQEGSLSIDDNGEFLSFEPTDTKNRILHLPIEHLAYCGALRRIRRDKSDERNQDQIQLREYENVDLANRYPQHIIGPPIFVAVFHGFDNSLCYTFVTQSSEDACLLVMKLMKAFTLCEQRLQMQDQERIKQENALQHKLQTSAIDNNQILSPALCTQLPNTIDTVTLQNLPQGQPILSSSSLISPYVNNLPIVSTVSSKVCYPIIKPSTIIMNKRDTYCCCPSCSIVQQNNIVCNGSCCTQCCLPISSCNCITRTSLTLPDCY